MKKFYIMNGQNQEGSFEIEQLKLLNIKKDTFVWFEGIENQIIADKVEDLKSILPINVSPPKFENPIQNNFSSTPPYYNNSSNNIQNDYPKNNLKRNLIISGTILIGLIIIGFISNNYKSNSYRSQPTYNVDVTENTGVSEAEIERQRINSAITKKI